MRQLLSALTLAGAAASAAPLPAETFVVDQEPGYKPVQAALHAYVDGHGTPHGVQHFCVIGYRVQRSPQAETFNVAWVYWHEGQRLVHWEAAAADVDSKETLTRSPRDLDLRKDVVAGSRDIGSSTYRIDRPWLQHLLADCKRRGQRFETGRP